MKSIIREISHYTSFLLDNLNLDDENNKVKTADSELASAIRAVKDLSWDSLCSLKDEDRQELTVAQQKVHECYAALRRVLLEVYRDMFDTIKGL